MRWDLLAGEAVSLERLLAAREARACLQRALIAHLERPVISFTCVMPGAVKRCPAARGVFLCGLRALRVTLQSERILPLYERLRDPVSGPEGYLVTSQTDALALKRLLIGIEEGHALGRLFDMDVIAMNGAPVSRAEAGLPGRRCIVCGAPAIDCVSRQMHPLRQVQEAVLNILS